MNRASFNKDFFSFLSSSPTPFHAVATIEKMLDRQGFVRLEENKRFQLVNGGAYYLTKEDGAIVSFILGDEEPREMGFRMLAAHTDSPCLQIKPRPEIQTGSYMQLGVEVYGGSLLAPWFDRDLSLAGRVCCRMSGGGLKAFLMDFRRPMLTIPSIALHLEREVNSSNTINRQKHLPPIFSLKVAEQLPRFKDLLLEHIIKEHPGTMVDDVLSFDIFCYDVQKPGYVGAQKDLISGARLDNLLSCHTGAVAMGGAERRKNAIFFCANHEENGSVSSSGANSSFFESVLERIIPDPVSRRISLGNSYLISMDNAHASHPNFMDKSDPQHEILLNNGPVIKLNANQRYATSSLSSAVYKEVCRQAEIVPQEFVMRSDMPCGSTIGPTTSARLGVRTIDIGAPSLSMHSIREHTGALDPYLLYRTIRQFLKSEVHKEFIDS